MIVTPWELFKYIWEGGIAVLILLTLGGIFFTALDKWDILLEHKKQDNQHLRYVLKEVQRQLDEATKKKE